jgi:hypothetical protein
LGAALEQAKMGTGPGYAEVVNLLEAHFKQYPNGTRPTEMKPETEHVTEKLPNILLHRMVINDNSEAVSSLLKQRAVLESLNSEQKNSFEAAMITQFQNFTKPSFQVSASGLAAFLRFVAEGEQEKAKAMLIGNPALALVSGDVKDLSKRTFTNITGFQYAIWALDWHMWTMIRDYLPVDEVKKQVGGVEAGVWVRSHGVHANLNTLIQAYQTIIDLYNARKWDEGDKVWVQQVGGAQFLLPAHVVNEYCHPTRPFSPCPNFKAALDLPRTRKIDEGEWFSASYNGGRLGEKFAVGRDARSSARARRLWKGVAGVWIGWEDMIRDHAAVRELISTRIAQRDELISEFSLERTFRV